MKEKIKYKKFYKKGITEDILKDIEDTFFNQEHESQIKIDSLDICHIFGYFEEKDKEIERLNNIINGMEKYIVEEIDDAQEELNIILQGNDLDYKNECTKEFNCIKNALDMLLNKLKELKEGK